MPKKEQYTITPARLPGDSGSVVYAIHKREPGLHVVEHYDRWLAYTMTDAFARLIVENLGGEVVPV